LVQILSAGVLGVLAWQLPAPEEVRHDFENAATVTRAASRQLMVDDSLRESNPQLAERATLHPAGELRQHRDSLDAVAQGLRALAAAFDPQPPKKLGQGLSEAADYLDKQLVPAAERAAKELDEASALLQTDTLRLAELLRAAPLDLDAVQTVHDALGRFAAGTDALHRMLELSRLGEIRNGLQGLDHSLAAAAAQVDHLSGYSYPVVRVERWKPHVDYKPFWPEGENIAVGLNKASTGVKAADKELETIGKELPKVRAAVDSSRQILEKSRDTLAVVLKHRELIEPLVKSLPETAARLADDLPKLTKQFSVTLRDTERLKEMAKGLRETQAHLDRSVESWPEVRRTLLSAADGIEARRLQLDAALASSQEDRQQTSLVQLRTTLAAVADSQAAQGETMSRWLATLRWTLGALAVCLALSGLGQFVRKTPKSRLE
jgi:ABC-type transporter Mla subunit MlaD